jgi:hypothetical protein
MFFLPEYRGRWDAFEFRARQEIKGSMGSGITNNLYNDVVSREKNGLEPLSHVCVSVNPFPFYVCADLKCKPFI